MPSQLRTPQQDRSRKTLERILQATESLLEERSFEQISIQEIVQAAGTSVGAFYTRFANKQTLLPLLYERYDERIRDSLFQEVERDVLAQPDLSTRARSLIDGLLQIMLRSRGFMRAMGFHARQNPELLPEDLVSRRLILHRRMAGLLLDVGETITHPNPERAVEIALFAVASTMREKLLFGGAPHAQSIAEDVDLLRAELVDLLLHYLTAPRPS